MKQGAKLFNEQYYWECHEALEEVWLEDRGDPARYVYWAVIQVACCLLHWRDGNLVGAEGMLDKAKGKLKRWEKEEAENPLLERNLYWSEFSREISALGKGASLEGYKNLARFRFKNPDEWEYDL